MDRTATPVAPSRGALRPLGLDEVQITGGFWAQRQAVNATASLGHIEHWMEREGWIGNFDAAAAGTSAGRRAGREFSDSEVYKLLEAMAWEVGRTDDEVLDARFRAIVGRVGAAQEPDGYLNTNFGRPGQRPRYSDLEWGHELYCYGHLFQAAVARARTRPDADDGLLGIALRAADHVVETFEPGGVASVCGHPEVEPALVELGRTTDRRYVEQAALFVERRGTGTLTDVGLGRAYYQDDVPVRDATVLRGHAVRANYLAAGAVDVAVETADEGLLAALTTQWENTVARRTYVTGGQGSQHEGESFGEDFVLPADRAYSETCAGVGSVMFSWRLLLAQGLPRYADLIERTLYNVVATSPSHEGTAYYYTNTLHQRVPGTVPPADAPSPRASSSLRAPWFAVSCCPPNVARMLASLAAYVATTDDDGLQLHQYAPARIRTRLADGRRVELDVETDYPREGVVRATVVSAEDRPWTLTLRVPAWAHGATLRTPDAAQPAPPGTVSVRRRFAAGDVVELHLPMHPRISHPDPRIDAVRGCVAVERGPEVLCLESVDLAGHADVSGVRLDVGPGLREVDGRVLATLRTTAPADVAWPYGSAHPEQPVTRTDVPLTAYHDWANRGPSTMRVWLPVA
ncbi:glycoside hydrolase family 127 protein [Cellulomonas fengjieae]|uniref:glycoside hydrolase family 127 protein n=1 Tax=Cellulomonas fengjieae TaxID=2819978 RepID=UPI001AAF04D9|nr:beta-L-arabinofuranosidase domain-containing protein [Cellulomonas fengjieae]MBO3100757.1 glycoside hydrolase family 127 protein [Cellulomonas fengjieae]